MRAVGEVMEGRKGIGENRTVAAGDGANEVASSGVLQGWPRGSAYFEPEIIFGAEAVHEGRYGRSGCQRGTVEAREDVRVDDVGV